MNKQPNSVWIIEQRFRSRKNGKWDAWEARWPFARTRTAYAEYPATLIENQDRYESRAVEYVRKEEENHER
jgi:hypothetical protein